MKLLHKMNMLNEYELQKTMFTKIKYKLKCDKNVTIGF